jgi:acyl-CoA synthetase (NDP forming)
VLTLCKEKEFSALLIAVPYAEPNAAEKRAELICEAARSSQIPIVIAWMNEALDCTASRIYEKDENVAFFRSMTQAMEAIRAWQWRDALRVSRHEPSAKRLSSADAFDAVRPVLMDAAKNNRALSERNSKLVLQEYGVRTTKEQLATNRSDAIQAAETIGFPVVLKVESADILHKSDAGLVALDLKTAEAVGDAFDTVMARAAERFAEAKVEGAVIQEMVPQGTEIIVGAKYEPGLGQVLMFGLGGVFVELLKDVAFSLAPVAKSRVLTQLTELKSAALLRGYRGAPGVDLDLLADQIARISEFVADSEDLVAELDVNPILARADDATAVDAVIIPNHTARAVIQGETHA